MVFSNCCKWKPNIKNSSSQLWGGKNSDNWCHLIGQGTVQSSCDLGTKPFLLWNVRVNIATCEKLLGWCLTAVLVEFIFKYCSQYLKNFQCICFIFKIPALKIVDPALIHVEVVHDNFVTCGKINWLKPFLLLFLSPHSRRKQESYLPTILYRR